MIWKKVTIETTVPATDIVSSVLFECGICGVQIEDNTNLSDEDLKKMYVDIPLNKVDDGKSYVSYFISIDNNKLDTKYTISTINENKNNNVVNDIIDNSYKPSTDNVFTSVEYNQILSKIKSKLEDYKSFLDLGPLTFTEKELDDKVFLNKWKDNFKEIDIDNIIILPSFEKENIEPKLNKNLDNSKNKINVYIDPANAFGTGQHATTKLCIKLINKVASFNGIDKKKSSMLDVGCGSGILTIVGKKVGFNKAVAIDVDKDTEDNLLTNLKLNDIKANSLTEQGNFIVKYGFGNILENKDLCKKVGFMFYDLVVANILAPVIISLLGQGKVHKYLKNSGFFICSGIIKEKENEVKKAIIDNANLRVCEVLRDGEWVAFLTQKL